MTITLGGPAATALNDLVSSIGGEIVEIDRNRHELYTQLTGWCGIVNGRPIMVFPSGQDPVIRLRLAEQFVARTERITAAVTG